MTSVSELRGGLWLSKGEVGAADVGGGEDAEEGWNPVGWDFGEGAFDVSGGRPARGRPGRGLRRRCMPASRVASMAVMVEPPVVQTSSTMTTCAPGWRKPSMRRPVPWVFSALRTRKPWMSVGAGSESSSSKSEVGAERAEFGVVGERARPMARGGVGDQRIGAHGQAANGDRMGHVLADEVVEDQAAEPPAFGMQRGGAAVDVVVGLLSAGEREVAKPEGERGDEVEEGGAGSR